MTLYECFLYQLPTAVDYDGAFGIQCVDLFRYYVEYLSGVNSYKIVPPVENAKDLCRHLSVQLSAPQVGCIAISDDSKTGHVGLVHSFFRGDLVLLEQNGFTQEGIRLHVYPVGRFHYYSAEPFVNRRLHSEIPLKN